MINTTQLRYLIPAKTYILDSDGKKHLYLGLDDDKDLIVKCRAALGGKITLLRIRCFMSK